jgi:glycosyltransferase involved in cell wall biosynthesis
MDPAPRLLVFGINYAPERISTGLNTTGLSRGLAALGWDVTVVTGYPHYPEWRRQPAPQESTIDAVRVLRRWHYVPARQSVLKRGAFELSWFSSALPTILPRRPVDVVLGVVPNLSAAPLAAAAAARYNAPLALLFQDLNGRAAVQTAIAGADRFARVIRRFETGLARRAEGIAVVAEGFRPYFLDAGVRPERITRIRNPHRLPPATEAREAVRARLGWREGECIVLHTGNMGFKQGLETVVHAAAQTGPDPSLRFVLQGDGSRRAELEGLARRLGVTSLAFLPLASDADFPNIVRAADVLLLNQRGSVRNMSMPGKLGTYFAAGLPVVAAVAKDDETALEVARSGGGVVVEADNPTALLAAIVTLRRDPGRAAALGAAGQAYATCHLSEASFVEGILGFLQAAIARRQDAIQRRSLRLWNDPSTHP